MTLLLLTIFSILIGSIAGLVAGFFGVGGGVIYVPGLLFYFKSGNYPAITQFATATSLGAILITSFYSGYLHRKRGEASLKEVLYIITGGIPGAFVGAKIAVLMDGVFLRQIFGGGELLVAILYLTILSKRQEGHNVPSPYALVLTGIAAGFLSGLLGIGGGIVAVPVMNLVLKMPIKRSVGNSSNMIFFNALAGVTTYLLEKPHTSAPPYTIGYVNIPASLLLGLSSIAAVKLSVSLFLKSENKTIKLLYSIFLIFIGLKLIFW